MLLLLVPLPAAAAVAVTAAAAFVWNITFLDEDLLVSVDLRGRDIDQKRRWEA